MKSVRIKIAEVVIELRSRYQMEELNAVSSLRWCHFIYRGKRRTDIFLEVVLKGRANQFPESRDKIFTCVHNLDGETKWALFKKGKDFVISQYALSQLRQSTVLNRDFNRGTVYALSAENGKAPMLCEIIQDLLHIILINYLSDKNGVFVHSVGLRDSDLNGILFAGPTQSGKSTTARIWNKHSRAQILSDDRIILRKMQNRFYLFSGPWCGDFVEYPKTTPDKAGLRAIFIIYHHLKNTAGYLRPQEAFKNLYPNIFPSFWNKGILTRQIRFCQDITKAVPCYRLGFRDDESVINFVRSIVRREKGNNSA